MDVRDVLCAQRTRDLFAIAKLVLVQFSRNFCDFVNTHAVPLATPLNTRDRRTELPPRTVEKSFCDTAALCRCSLSK